MSDRCEGRRRTADNRDKCFVCCEKENTANGDALAAAEDAREEREGTRQRRSTAFGDPVCINTSQIYDSCRDRDCVADQRVYLTQADQELIERAINVKLKKAEVIWVYTDVEPLSFNRGYFSVDLKFFVCVTLEVFCGVCNPTVIRGLTTFDKRVILFGSEGNSKMFSSRFKACGEITETWKKTNMPTVVVEVVEPVALSARLIEEDCDCCGCGCGDDSESARFGCECSPFPESICSCFDDQLVIDDSSRRVLVSYGLFSLVRLERDTQLLIDAVDFCIPTQECPSATEQNPCELFNDIRFPIDEFFPQQRAAEDDENNESCHHNHSCGCNRCGR